MSTRPHKLRTTLIKEEEDLIIFERSKKKLSLDDPALSGKGRDCALRDKIPNLYR